MECDTQTPANSLSAAAGDPPSAAADDQRSAAADDQRSAAPVNRSLPAEEMGRLLEEFRPYLLAIANAEFPPGLAAKLGPSDIVQLTLAKGHFRFDEFHGQSREELARWLRRILLNHLAAATRTYACEKRFVERERQEGIHQARSRQLSPSGAAASREERELMQQALARLPELYRQVIELRHRDDLSFEELGKQLGRSEEATRKLWTRSVRLLQRELGIDGKQRLPSRLERR